LGLAQSIESAVQRGATQFTIASGLYRFSNLTLVVSGARNLVVNVDAGTSFEFFLGYGVRWVDCDNVTVSGPLTLDVESANYAQGTVTAIHDADHSFSASFDPRFLVPDCTAEPFSMAGGLAGAKVAFWNASTRRMFNVGNQFMANSSSQGGKAWRVQLRARPNGASVGALVTVFPRRGETWHLLNSSRFTTHGITIHGGGNMGFLEQSGEGGNVYSSVAIRRRPGSAGLIALNADGASALT
jgi:hypothetical protein